MLQIYRSKAPNQSGYLLLALTFAVLSVMFLLFYIDKDILFSITVASDVVIVVLIALIICTWILYLLDEAIWQISGREECVCNGTGIIITKRRLIRRRKFIPWNVLSDVSPYTPNHLWQFITRFTVTGVPQDTIIIRYGRDQKYTCGAGLSRSQALDAINLIRNITNSGKQSERTELMDADSVFSYSMTISSVKRYEGCPGAGCQSGRGPGLGTTMRRKRVRGYPNTIFPIAYVVMSML